jgi:ATP-dependent Clp protease, protease subunit
VSEDLIEPRISDLDQHVRTQLFDQRIVVVSGALDVERTTRVAASLMTLDATGDDHIELRFLSCSGSIEDALAVIDVIDVLGVPVHTRAYGALDGGPVGILASGERRTVARNARLHLRDTDVTVAGSAHAIERALSDAAARRSCFFEHLASSVRRPVSDVEAEWALGSYLVSSDAVSLGYADELEGDRAERGL